MKRFTVPRGSFRLQILLSVLAVSLVLTLSTTYILVSMKNLQRFSDNSFEHEWFITSLQDDLTVYQASLLDYLSTRSSNALSRILIETQALRSKIPSYMQITANDAILRERELYSLIRVYLNLAENAMEEKRGRNIAAYTRIYDEMTALLAYINSEIEGILTEGFSGQMEVYSSFIALSGRIQLWNLLFIIFVSIFAVLALVWSVDRVTHPLSRVSAMAVELSAGHFEIPDIERSSIEEMDSLVNAFNRMKNDLSTFIDEIRWQENIKEEYMRERMRNMKMESLVRRMEIYALQAQMNPHFLFNTLNTGMQLAIVEGADRTGEYMEYLAQLFRHIIRNKEVIVPLRHEIEGLRYYFYLLQVRFPKTLDLSITCDDALLDRYSVPVSLLQPLVENCVIHAFKDKPEDNRVTVQASLEGQRLVLVVRDNGCGMDRDTTEKLLHPQSIDESSAARVMGLENVIQRLYFFYPDDPEVVGIESTEKEGTAIVIRIDTEKKPCIAF